MTGLERLADLVWGPWLLGLFLVTGGYLTVRSGVFQIRCCPLWLRTTAGALLRGRSGRDTGRGLTRLQAMSTALAATIGTGSIAGVATAIFYGGPGAVFWMWVSAFVGMMTGCVEKILAVRYRETDRAGRWRGGPMCYMEQGLGSPVLASLFALCCLAASLGGGNMVQANSIAAALESAFGWGWEQFQPSERVSAFYDPRHDRMAVKPPVGPGVLALCLFVLSLLCLVGGSMMLAAML